MWNHSTGFGSHQKSGDMDSAKSASPATSAGGGGSANTVSSERSEAEVETWMILEYCDKGSLQARFLRLLCPSSSMPTESPAVFSHNMPKVSPLVRESHSGFARGAVLPAIHSGVMSSCTTTGVSYAGSPSLGSRLLSLL